MIKIGTRTRHPNNILNNFMLKLCPVVYPQFHLVLKKTIWNIIVFILVLVFSSNEWNEHCSVTASMWPRLSKLQNSHKTEKKNVNFSEIMLKQNFQFSASVRRETWSLMYFAEDNTIFPGEQLDYMNIDRDPKVSIALYSETPHLGFLIKLVHKNKLQCNKTFFQKYLKWRKIN